MRDKNEAVREALFQIWGKRDVFESRGVRLVTRRQVERWATKRGTAWKTSKPASIDDGKKRRRPTIPLGPTPTTGYAVVLIRVPTDPEVALLCSTSPDLLPS